MKTEKLAIRTVQVVRYITPLREGGSLPAITEADDGFMYVLKFRGAGQGIKALIAELIGGELARLAGFKVPEIVFAHLDPAFGRTEPDEEIQDLLKASTGLNLGLHFLSGAITYDPVVTTIDSLLASKIVWFDSFITNVDRTARNTNLLYWNKELWLIDHGAALFFHHTWHNWQEQAVRSFSSIKDHVLLPISNHLSQAHEQMMQLITPEKIQRVVEQVPEEWLIAANADMPAGESREVYASFLQNRLQHSEIFVNQAKHARETLI